MPIQADFSLVRREASVLSVAMTPPVSITGWSLQFQLTRRFGATSGLITKSLSSGFINVSGMNVVNAGQGMFSVAINEPDTSGLNFGNFAYQIARTDSGARTVLSQGFLLLMPDLG